MDKPEERKPGPPAGQPPRPPIGGKKPDSPGKGPVPQKPGGPLPKLPLPGQKPGFPGRPPGGLQSTPPPPVPGSPGGSKPPQGPAGPAGPMRPPGGFPMRASGPPPQAPLNPAVEKGLSEVEANKNDLQDKISDLEKKLLEEREKVLLASLRSKEEEAVSAKVETSIKDIQDKLRREKKEQELEELRRKAEAKALDMERRLAEEREAWVQTLKNQLNQRDQITQEMETHFSSRLKDLEHRWSQEKSTLESNLKEREAELIRVRQEIGLKSEQERAFWEDRLRNVTVEKEKNERDLERIRDKAQQEKDQLMGERQMLRDQVTRLEAQVRMLEDQHRLDRQNVGREQETLINSLKQQALSDREQKEKELESLKRQITMDLEQAHKQITALNLQIQTQSKETIEKAGQIESLKTQMSGLSLQLEQANGRLGDRDRIIDSLKGKQQDAEVEKQRAQAALDHAVQQKKEYEAMLDEARAAVRSKESALDEARRGKLAVEEELKGRMIQDEETIKKLQEDLIRARNEYREEIRRLQNENDERVKALHARLEPFEINAMKIYNETRDQVRKEMEQTEKALQEATRRLDDLSQADVERDQFRQERDELKQQLEDFRGQTKEVQWSLESQIKALQDELRGEKIRAQQSEENRQAVETDLKQRMEARAYDQALLEERQQEIDRLTKNFDTLRKAFEAQKVKVPALNKEVEDLRRLLHEKGLQTHAEFRAQLDEKTKEVERLQNSIKNLKETSSDNDKKEEIFREKERVFRQLIEDKDQNLAEFKNRAHSLERRVDEFSQERESYKSDTKKEIEKVIQAKDHEMSERLEAQKKEIQDGLQDQIEKAKFRAAQDAVEKMRADLPEAGQSSELIEAQIRAQLEKEAVAQLKAKETAHEESLKVAQTEAKKTVDKLKWEIENMKTESRKVREARDQIEREAQDLLQQASDHYRTELENKVQQIKAKAKRSRGFFSAIAKVLDFPIIDFSRKKIDEDADL